MGAEVTPARSQNTEAARGGIRQEQPEPFSSEQQRDVSRLFGLATPAVKAGRAERVDGPSVFRDVVKVSVLEQDERLRGKLTPPEEATPPEGVSLRTQADGSRILTINIHMAVPADVALEPKNENIDALRDVARYINSVNPDVVVMQEVRDRPMIEGQAGLPHPTSILFHLIRASDMAFTPAIEGDPVQGTHQHYGTAIYTRNGYTIDRAVNAALPNQEISEPRVDRPAHEKSIERRSVGIASIRPPRHSSEEPFTVMSTHLANWPEDDRHLRIEQLAEVGRIAGLALRDGAFTYVDALTLTEQRASGFPGDKVLAGGDLNQKQEPTDAVLKEQFGLAHVNELLAREEDPARRERARLADASSTAEHLGEHKRIDHLYGLGSVKVRDVAVAGVRPQEYSGPRRTVGNVMLASTDHNGVVVDFQ